MNIIPFCVQLWLMPSCVAALFLTINRSWASVASRPFLLSQTLIPERATANTRNIGRFRRINSSRPPTGRIRTSFSSLAMTEATAVDIVLKLQDVRNRIEIASDKATAASSLTNAPGHEVQLVAVSKTKPLELLMAAYDQGNQRLFGENYVQELIEKAQLMPSDVHWHFIGTLQSNKVNGLIKAVVPKAASLTVETVSTLKLANKLNTAMQALKTDDSSSATADSDIPRFLPIFVQVNTSGEDTKGGVEPDQVVALCLDITTSCDQLQLKGLMTIGAEGDLSCFESLCRCREQAAEALNVPITDLALSMGMSGDFEEAILQGATHVRIGSTIFGARDYSVSKP